MRQSDNFMCPWCDARAAKATLLEAVKTFDAFDTGNDPYNEHAFVSVEIEGEKYLTKIEYYDRDIRFG